MLLSLYILDIVVAVVSTNKAHCCYEALINFLKNCLILKYIVEFTGSIQMNNEKKKGWGK
jgi:hypothetical protein